MIIIWNKFALKSLRFTARARRATNTMTKQIQRVSGKIWVRFAFNRLKSAGVRRTNVTIKQTVSSIDACRGLCGIVVREARALSETEQTSRPRDERRSIRVVILHPPLVYSSLFFLLKSMMCGSGR